MGWTLDRRPQPAGSSSALRLEDRHRHLALIRQFDRKPKSRGAETGSHLSSSTTAACQASLYRCSWLVYR
jgi:hypothetical protein